jgi:hypothetical protein
MYAVTLDPAERATFSNKLVRNIVKGGDEGTAFQNTQTRRKEQNRTTGPGPLSFLAKSIQKVKRGRRKATPHAIWAANSVSKRVRSILAQSKFHNGKRSNEVRAS